MQPTRPPDSESNAPRELFPEIDREERKKIDSYRPRKGNLNSDLGGDRGRHTSTPNSNSHRSQSKAYEQSKKPRKDDRRAPPSRDSSTKSQDQHKTSEAMLAEKDLKLDHPKSQYKIVKCWNLVGSVVARDLYFEFSECENFVVVEMQVDKRQKNKGVAFIKFQTAESAKNAMDELKGTRIKSRKLSMALAVRADHDHKIDVSKWGDIQEAQWKDTEIRRIDRLLDHKAETFADAYVDFTTMVKRHYPEDSSIQRKQRIFESFKDAAGNAYQNLVAIRPLITSVNQLIPGRSALSRESLAALFYDFIIFAERIKDMRHLKKLWDKEIRLGSSRDKDWTLRVYKNRNFMAHINWGGLHFAARLRPAYQSLHEDIDSMYDDFKELTRRWDACFERVMLEERNPNDEYECHKVEESFYDQSA